MNSTSTKRLVRIGVALLLAMFFLTVSAQAESNKIQIGSKSFTESVILGEVLTHLARSTGVEVEHRAELGGTQILWQALQAGDIDAYVDYTGTIREELLSDVLKQGVEVRSERDMQEQMAKKQVIMSEHLGFNNTYALGMRDSIANAKNISKISDLLNHQDLEFGISDEFMERKDGWKQLATKYRFPKFDVKTMDHNLAYRGLERNSIQVTDLYTTDAEIEYYRLRVLEDNKGFFPTYYAVVLMRSDLKDRFPKVVDALLSIVGKIDSSAMTAMSANVRLDRKLETNVAAEFLNEKLNLNVPLAQVDASAEWRRFFWRLATTTKEHLFLVLVSLGLAILSAIPLGVFAAKNEHAGNFILSIVGVIQTLPSMALLVFMIPLFGLGAVPAIAALFFYSLLPIVRNTYAGLTQIPTPTRESAEVIGLPSSARLKLIELPLAMPSILAGVKTAAVINVGTATIGALIGAGGYGAPILTGIRLSSISLILQGAIPAALMAVLVQYLFSWFERWCVSPGLRLK